MPQIYITSLITSVITVLAIGGFIRWRTAAEDRRLLLYLFLAELPMAFIAYYIIRLPLVDSLSKYLLHDHQAIYGFVKVLYAPLTEEPAKVLPLLLPFVRARITRDNFVPAAMALGLGFGVGEIWLVGSFVAAAPQFSDMPWYYFTGFLNERIMVCLIHGAMTALALNMLRRKFIFGLLAAMLMHFLGNFPIYLTGINFGDLGKETWQVITQFWVVLYFISSLVILARLHLGTFKITQFLYDNSVCPGCGFTYPPPLLGINWFTKRYEQCPSCKKWHWVGIWKKKNELK